MRSNGQTLVEVMVTLAFIVIGVVALLRFQTYLAYNNHLSYQTGKASLIALSEIESLGEFQVLTPTSGYTAYSSIASRNSTQTASGTTYSISSTVTAYTNPTYKNIDVTVSWPDRYGVTKSIRQISNVASVDPQTSVAIK